MSEAIPNCVFLFFYLSSHFLQLCPISLNNASNWSHLFAHILVAFLQVHFYLLNGFSSSLHFMLAMSAMDSALWADRSIAVKAEVRQFFLRMGLTHIKRLLGLWEINVIVWISWVWGLWYRCVRVRIWHCALRVRWSRMLVILLFLLILWLYWLLSSTCWVWLLIFICLCYWALSSSVIESLFSLNILHYTLSWE